MTPRTDHESSHACNAASCCVLGVCARATTRDFYRLVSSATGDFIADFALTSAPSLDHLIRALQQRRRDRQAENLGGLEVDDKLEFRWPLHR
jgi:hypothetical protein